MGGEWLVGKKGTQSTIPGSQDAEGREELAGDASSSIPLCTWLHAKPWPQRGGWLLPGLQRAPSPVGEGVTTEDTDKPTDHHSLLLRKAVSQSLY